MSRIFQDIKKQLKFLAACYKIKKAEFSSRQKKIIKSFKLKKETKKQLFFGLIMPENKSIRKYAEILNSDLKLNNLFNEIKNIYLSGNLLIIKIIIEKEIVVTGYDLNSFLCSPNENYYEIDNLIKGLSGYKHIHIIDEKIALEIPARHYLKGYPNVIKLIDYWNDKLEVFTNQ